MDIYDLTEASETSQDHLKKIIGKISCSYIFNMFTVTKLLKLFNFHDGNHNMKGVHNYI